jgi:hypothetical protein
MAIELNPRLARAYPLAVGGHEEYISARIIGCKVINHSTDRV